MPGPTSSRPIFQTFREKHFLGCSPLSLPSHWDPWAFRGTAVCFLGEEWATCKPLEWAGCHDNSLRENPPWGIILKATPIPLVVFQGKARCEAARERPLHTNHSHSVWATLQPTQGLGPFSPQIGEIELSHVVIHNADVPGFDTSCPLPSIYYPWCTFTDI